MTQKADHQVSHDYYDSYGRSDHQSRWIWGSLAALAVLAAIVWYASQSGLNTSPAPTTATTSEESAPVAPAAPALEPAAPATQPAQPAQQ